MYWADSLAEKIKKEIHHRVDDMKTPSGHAHAGSLRAIATHGLLYEAMKHDGHDVEFTYVVNDMDPMDGLPSYLDPKIYESHMGRPVYQIPAPDGVSASFAAQYANEYIEAFNYLGFKPQIFWSSILYKEGILDPYIKLVLDNVEKIRIIYKRESDQDKPEGWYPFQVICPECGKVGTSLVTDWDGEHVTYACKVDLVRWAKGCGARGKISPFGGTGKLMWKVDWAAHWAALHVTVEGAGKDHFSHGGSRYVAAAITREVFNLEPPFGFLHEFLLIGGAKMSSSKGNATSAADFVKILPPELGRFLHVRTPYQRAINFDPMIPDTIPDLFDEYDRCAKGYFGHTKNEDYGRFFEASQLKKNTEPLYLPRFRQVATLSQMPSVNLQKFFEAEKGSSLTEREIEILDERIQYAKIWLAQFASQDDKFEVKKEIPDKVKDLSNGQKEFLVSLADLLQDEKSEDGEVLQQKVFELSKTTGIGARDAFGAIYISLLGKFHGPKAGWLIADLLQQDREFIISRFKNV